MKIGRGSYTSDYGPHVGYYAQLNSAVASCIRRNATARDYELQLNSFLSAAVSPHHRAMAMFGLLSSLRQDIASGLVKTIAQRAEDAVFSDFTDMARHIAKTAHPAPAIVLAVSVLEERIRRLAEETEGVEVADDKGRPRKFEALVTDLKRPEVAVFRESQYKELTGWYSLRTQCAHGIDLDTVDKEAAFRLIDGVESYLAKLG